MRHFFQTVWVESAKTHFEILPHRPRLSVIISLGSGVQYSHTGQERVRQTAQLTPLTLGDVGASPFPAVLLNFGLVQIATNAKSTFSSQMAWAMVGKRITEVSWAKLTYFVSKLWTMAKQLGSAWWWRIQKKSDFGNKNTNFLLLPSLLASIWSSAQPSWQAAIEKALSKLHFPILFASIPEDWGRVWVTAQHRASELCTGCNSHTSSIWLTQRELLVIVSDLIYTFRQAYIWENWIVQNTQFKCLFFLFFL